MAKERTPVPPEVAARVLFESDRTCCVCREPGKAHQIHHLDEDPTSHAPDNLAVLCLDCHDQTQLSGGFGRKLDAHQVREFRADWLDRVARRRDAADEIASARTSGVEIASIEQAAAAPPAPPIDADRKHSDLLLYIGLLPAIREKAYARSQPLWDGGVTAEVMRGSYDLVEVLRQILVHLAGWYPPNHFGGVPADQYVAAVTASRFEWHRAHLEPSGAGTGGTIVGPLAAGAVIDDIERMISDMVSSLLLDEEALDLGQWKASWVKQL